VVHAGVEIQRAGGDRLADDAGIGDGIRDVTDGGGHEAQHGVQAHVAEVPPAVVQERIDLRDGLLGRRVGTRATRERRAQLDLTTDDCVLADHPDHHVLRARRFRQIKEGEPFLDRVEGGANGLHER